MIRNLKTLGLAAAAVLALSAMAASTTAAQTPGKFTSEGPVTLTGAQTGEESANALTIPGFPLAKFECSERVYLGHRYNVTPHRPIPIGSTEVTITPNLVPASCMMRSGLGTIDLSTTTLMNGCDYVLRDATTTGGVEGTYGITTDLICPIGKSITIRVYTDATKKAEDKPFCIFHFPAQMGSTGAHLTDAGNGDLTLTGTFEKIHINTTKIEEHWLCPASTQEAKQDIDLTIQGHNEFGEGTSIGLSD